jgi:arginine decarboxylase
LDNLTPKRMFFTKGLSYHRNQLQSFELALRSAGIEMCNLVYVSSIFPPDCKIITKENGMPKLKPGQITFVVLARADTNEPNRLVSAAGLKLKKLKQKRVQILSNENATFNVQ